MIYRAKIKNYLHISKKSSNFASKIYRTMSTAALQNVWDTLLGYNLSTANKRWLAEHLIEQVEKETAEQVEPYTMEEINARIDRAEADIAAGRVHSREEMSQMMNDFVAEYE